MALARVVSFEGVSAERMAEMRREIEQGERPADVPASEFLMLHDPEGERALAIVFFDTDEDYARGDAALDAMPAAETPGRRAVVEKYEVTARMTT